MEETNGTQTAHDAFKRTLREYWGYPDFRGIQRDIIESIAQGKDTLGLMPTGGGKSITFQVPALVMPGVCVAKRGRKDDDRYCHARSYPRRR